MLHQGCQRQRRIVQQRQAGVHDLGEIMGRDVGRHADRDTRLPIDEQVRDACGQHRRLVLGLVVVRGEIDGFFLDVRQQLMRDPRHADFGVTHGGRHVAIHRPEVSLAIDEHVAHRERLRHAHHRVVHRGIPCGWYLPMTSPTMRADFL